MMAAVWLLGVMLLVEEEGVLIPKTGRIEAPLTLGMRAPEPQQMEWGTSKKLIAFAVLGQVLDLVSTDVVLARGGIEMSPLMRNRAMRYMVKGLFMVTALGLSETQQAKAHPKFRIPGWKADGAAKTIGWTGLIPGLTNTVQAVVR